MKEFILNDSTYRLYLGNNVFINQYCDVICVEHLLNNIHQSKKTNDYHLLWSNHRANITLEYYRARENNADTLVIDKELFYNIKSIDRETKIVHIFSNKFTAYSLRKPPIYFQYKRQHPIEHQKVQALFNSKIQYLAEKEPSNISKLIAASQKKG